RGAHLPPASLRDDHPGRRDPPSGAVGRGLARRPLWTGVRDDPGTALGPDQQTAVPVWTSDPPGGPAAVLPRRRAMSDTRPFQYEAIGRDGQISKGVLSETNEAAVLRRLAADGLTALKISPAAVAREDGK